MNSETIEQQEFTHINMDGVPHLGPIRYIKAPISPTFKDAGGSNSEQCMVCGRKVNTLTAHAFHAINGGGYLLHPDDEYNYVYDGGDMCTQYVGPDCLRRYPQLKEYEHKAGGGINQPYEQIAA